MFKILLSSFMVSACIVNAQIINQPLGSSTSLDYDQRQKQEYEHQKAQLCGYFSQLVSNFLNIVQRPHDSAHVSGNIAGALDNIVKIAMNCVGRAVSRIKRSGAALTPEDIEQIKDMMRQELAQYEDVIRAAVMKSSEQLDAWA